MSEPVPNRIRRATVLALASSPLAVSTRAHAADNWQAYTFWGSPTVVASKGFRKIVTDIEEASGGELKIKFNLGGTLSINAANIGSSISDDVIQLADDSFYAGAIPVAPLATLPFLSNSVDEVNKVMTVVRPIVERDYGKRGVTMLGYYVYPPQVFWFRGNVTSLDQIKGRKLRVSTAEQGDFLKRIGATPVQVTSAEVPAALERGIVDGVLTASAGGILAWKDLLKSSYQLGVNYHVSYIIANTARLQKLPADMQAKIRAVVNRDCAELTADLQRDDVELRQKFAAEGIAMTAGTDKDRASAAALAKETADAWAKSRGPEAVESLAKARALLGR
jgi:TRAP-type transport system periplasmic protein